MKYFKSTLAAGVTAVVMASASVSAADLPFAPGEGDFNWASFEELKNSDFKGEQVTVFGPWLGPDQELVESVLGYFAEATGADVKYTGSDSFEQQIMIDAEAGSAPNIAVFPQPGLAALVWYSPDNFADAGYDVPESMEDLIALSDQIVADGGTPWCIGLGSGGATGWPATDWVEDMMLRTQSTDVYDQWVANEIPFTDERIVAAIEEFGAFARNDDYVAGGSGVVASTDFRDSPKGLFSSPPQCYMHRQASFIPAFFPEGTEVGEDADFFYFPAYADKDLGSPVLGAGTLFAITDDSPATRGLMEFLKSPIAHEVWMAQQGFLTPHKGVNTDLYANDTLRGMGEILLGATTFRFDGSDLMPGGVGAGSFWTGMVDYAGGKDAAEVAKGIQDSWDALK